MSCVLNAYSDDDVFINVLNEKREYFLFRCLIPFARSCHKCELMNRKTIRCFCVCWYCILYCICFMPSLFCLLIKFIFSTLNRNLLIIKITKSHRLWYFFCCSYRCSFSGREMIFVPKLFKTQSSHYVSQYISSLFPGIMQIVINETRPRHRLGIVWEFHTIVLSHDNFWK